MAAGLRMEFNSTFGSDGFGADSGIELCEEETRRDETRRDETRRNRDSDEKMNKNDTLQAMHCVVNLQQLRKGMETILV